MLGPYCFIVSCLPIAFCQLSLINEYCIVLYTYRETEVVTSVAEPIGYVTITIHCNIPVYRVQPLSNMYMNDVLYRPTIFCYLYVDFAFIKFFIKESYYYYYYY